MMRNLTLFLATICCALFFAQGSVAQQLDMPAPSPASTIMQKVGLVDAKVVYSRPSMKGRTIFGDLVPYGEVWRTGANASTKVHFSDDVMIDGQKLEGGEYALYTIPGEDEWTVIFSKNTGLWGSGGYEQSDDALRVTVDPMSMDKAVETFTMNFANLTDEGADLMLMWDKTGVAIPITVNTDEQVMAQIDRAMKNPEASLANMYFQSANYYYSHDKDMDKALEWVNKAVDMRQDAFWMMHLKAKIQAEMGKKKEAIATAKKSMEVAKQANNMDYVRLNEKLIESMN
ncbi:DUF2911 domain-containing protein [Roseivirga sp. BDSF3-8]|uniref:DUF2911 domain-containing protein n=1 Tax=Roseivirga sp. BDSF3-8 TaxID=3241598 RepID=UPI003532127E